MSKIPVICIALLLLAVTVMADEARLLRFPDISAEHIAFAHGGDVFIVARNGGQAVRLTSDEGLELFPRFSPDGRQIAMTAQYDGDWAVYVIPITGGEPKRLTYHPGIQNTSERFGPENVVMDWHPTENKILFRSRKQAQDWWDGRVYLVSVDGGLPTPLPMATAGFTSFSPKADQVAYCPIYRDFRTWKRYKGGMAQDVWIFNLSTYESQKITDWVGTDNMPMWYQDRIYFNSDRTGKLNLYCYETNTGQTRQVTEFDEYDVRWPALGPDAIVFENAGFLYIMELPSETVHKVPVTITTDRNAMRGGYVSVSDQIREFDLSPDGKRAVFSARDDIFTVPAKHGNTRNLTNSSGSKEKDPVWSPDGRWIAFTSDSTGEQELYVISSDRTQQFRLTTDGHCYRFPMTWSPDSKKLALTDRDLNLYYVDIDSRKIKAFDRTEQNIVDQFSWSPDSKYLAYAKANDVNIQSIFIYSLDRDTVYQATLDFTDDKEPVFSPDGKYLYFLSDRSFNPILSEYEFEFVNNGITNIYLILLSAETPSPFEPESDEVSVADDTAVEKDKAEKKGDVKTPPEVVIDFDGVFNRQIALNLPAGKYSGLEAIDKAVFYLSDPLRGLRGNVFPGTRNVHKYDMTEKRDAEFVSDIRAYTLAGGGKHLLIQKGQDYYIIETDKCPDDLSSAKLDLSGMSMFLDRSVEYAQMLDEARRLYRDFFYDKNMHGVDWQKEYDKYAALVPYVSHRFDLTYLIGEMIGELCCSHAYTGGGDMPKLTLGGVGLLGVDFAVDQVHDRIVIERILRGENWDKSLRSPLLEPGIDVHEGDYLLAINGHELTAAGNPYQLTENTVGKTITITVNDKPDLKGAREYTVTPIADEESLRYYNWVEDRRRYVDSVSSGTIGYIHIPDMGGFGLVQFNKMFYHQVRRDGLIIDVRYNGGGFVSGLIADRFLKKVINMWSNCLFGYGPSPGTGIVGHMITLQNEFSCSDGDIFPFRFRVHKLGPLMGTRTWGGVVGFDMVHQLSDGGYCIIPEGGMYDFDGKWLIENEGVYPDIEIDNPPERLAQGYDDQLREAIAYLKKKIAEEPPLRMVPPETPPER
ncbi:MAG: PD40 domain-containing protein [candidate division Zixibacteria bacterium]|nr:PD40 domain-containing protein [candidate division Zixibacteria bacterium]